MEPPRNVTNVRRSVLERVLDVVRELGRLDVLINSSAVMQRTPLGTVNADQWDAMMALNLRARNSDLFAVANDIAALVP